MVLESGEIRRQTTYPYTPEQFGVAEMVNRTLVVKPRCMLNNAKLGKFFWAETISTVTLVMNLCTARSLEDNSPEEV